MLRLFLLLIAVPLSVNRAGGQTLFAVVLGNQKYVVGSSTLRSGLFRSADGGNSWEHLGPQNLKSFSMDAPDSARGSVLYIAAGNGVHRSLDSGRTWRIVTGWEITEVLDVKVVQSDPQWVFAATAWGLWASSNSGDSWERLVDHFTSDTTVEPRYCYRFATTDEGTTLLTDSAIYTIEIQGGRTAVLHRRAVVAGAHALIEHVRASGTVVATTQLRGYEPGSYKPHLESNGILEGIERAPEGAIYDLVEERLESMSDNGSYPIVMASQHGLFMMHPGVGTAWSDIGQGLPKSSVHTLAWLPGYNQLVAGTFGDGIFRYEAHRWVASGLEGSQVWRLVVKQW